MAIVVVSRDYNKLFKQWTISKNHPVLKIKLNKTISPDLAKLYVMMDKQLCEEIVFDDWDEQNNCYVKNIFLRQIKYYGYDVQDLHWKFTVTDLITNELKSYSFFHFNEMKNILKNILNQKVII
jgi:hypothetical protein